MLEDEARDVGIFTGQHQLDERAAHRFHRSHQVFEHVGVMDADLQHDASRHACGRVAPRAGLELAQPVAADVALGIDELAEHPIVDLAAYPPKMAFAAALVAEGEHNTCFPAGSREGARVGNRVGDGLVEKHMLARSGGGTRGFEVYVVRRRIDDRLDFAVFQYGLVAGRRAAAILGGEGLPFLLGPRVARDDAQLAGARNRISKHVRPPSHAEAGDS